MTPRPLSAVLAAAGLLGLAGPAAADDPAAGTAAAAEEVAAPATSQGARARLLADGTATVPHAAPARVRRLIAAANEIVGRPYEWGGGHATIVDDGYDCSGAVSYALIRAGLLDAPLTSGAFAAVLAGGAGEWISVYGSAEHAYLEVAGLRLDTSRWGDPGGAGGARWRPVVGKRAGFAASHPAGVCADAAGHPAGP